MPWQVFEKAAIETGQHAHAFMRLHARGEPTLHPQFVEMISFAKQVGVTDVQVFTNGLTMNEDLAYRVLTAGVDVIEFSVHGHIRTYERLMGNKHFDRVVKNITGFIRIRDELEARTRVVVSAVDQPDFQPEKGTHQRFWRERADEVILRPFHSWGGRIACEVAETADRHPCPQLWTRLTIGTTGKILFCFNSWAEAEEEVAGNLLDEDATIAKIWRSEIYSRARKAHLAGNYTLQCCARCQDWTGSAWGENSYESLLQKFHSEQP